MTISRLHKPLQIAIDGPVASGKGDIAVRLSKRLNMMYVYTGAMYRMLALECINRGVSTKDPQRVIAVMNECIVDLKPPEKNGKLPYKAMLNGRDVSERIMDQDAAMGASDVGIIPEVRLFMVSRQKEIAEGKRVVMEGRDIGLKVLPDADLKLYLTADVKERAKRRFLQWQKKGVKITFEKTLEDTFKRDKQDSTREVDPLQKSADSVELDTTDIKQDEIVGQIISILQNKGLI